VRVQSSTGRMSIVHDAELVEKLVCAFASMPTALKRSGQKDEVLIVLVLTRR